MMTSVLALDGIYTKDPTVRFAIKRSRACIERSRALLTRSVHGIARRLHPICGGVDDPVPLVIDMLANGAAMCGDCIAKQTGIPLAEMPSAIARTRETLHIHTPRVPCTVCGTPLSVYRLYNHRAGIATPTSVASADCGEIPTL